MTDQEPLLEAYKSKRGRTGVWLALGAVVLAAGLVGGLLLTPRADRVEPLAVPTAPGSLSPSPAVTKAATRSVVLPAKLLAQPRLTDATLQKLADGMTRQFKDTSADADDAVSGFYGDLAKQKLTMVIAVEAPVGNPATWASGMTHGLKSSLNAGPFRDVDAGPLGGNAKCADAKASGITIAVCLWADQETYGVLGFYYRTSATVKSDFVKARAAIELPTP